MRFLPEFEFDENGRVRTISLPWGFIILMILLVLIS